MNTNNQEETIFRQKSIDRVSSPEQLDNYLKVTTPTVWLALVGIIVILVGAIVWATIGRLNTYAPTSCIVSDSTIVCYVKEEYIDKVENGMVVEILNEDKTFSIISIDKNGLLIPDEYAYLQHIIGVTSSDFVFDVAGLVELDNGFYEGKIVLESISPLKFIFN